MNPLFHFLGCTTCYGLLYAGFYALVEFIPVIKSLARVKYLAPFAIGAGLCILILGSRTTPQELPDYAAVMTAALLALWYALSQVRLARITQQVSDRGLL
jgi:hypothetical protein